MAADCLSKSPRIDCSLRSGTAIRCRHDPGPLTESDDGAAKQRVRRTSGSQPCTTHPRRVTVTLDPAHTNGTPSHVRTRLRPQPVGRSPLRNRAPGLPHPRIRRVVPVRRHPRVFLDRPSLVALSAPLLPDRRLRDRLSDDARQRDDAARGPVGRAPDLQLCPQGRLLEGWRGLPVGACPQQNEPGGVSGAEHHLRPPRPDGSPVAVHFAGAPSLGVRRFTAGRA